MTLTLRVDAYLLLQKADRLSEESMTALKSATRMLEGRWEMSCSDTVVKELWAWFDACEAISAGSRWSAWKVGVCQWSKWEIEKTLGKRTAPSYDRPLIELDVFLAKVTDTLVETRLAQERSAALREQSRRTRARALAAMREAEGASRPRQRVPP